MSSQLLKQSSVGGSSDVYIPNNLVVAGTITSTALPAPTAIQIINGGVGGTDILFTDAGKYLTTNPVAADLSTLRDANGVSWSKVKEVLIQLAQVPNPVLASDFTIKATKGGNDTDLTINGYFTGDTTAVSTTPLGVANTNTTAISVYPPGPIGVTTFPITGGLTNPFNGITTIVPDSKKFGVYMLSAHTGGSTGSLSFQTVQVEAYLILTAIS